VEAMIGFDIGTILSGEKKHGLTVGGAMCEIIGQDKSDFQAVHVLSTLPL
jgi:hypothetical protein